MSNQSMYSDRLINTAANFGMSLAVKMARLFAANLEANPSDMTPSQAIAALADAIEGQIIASEATMVAGLVPKTPAIEELPAASADVPEGTVGSDRAGGQTFNNEGDAVDDTRRPSNPGTEGAEDSSAPAVIAEAGATLATPSPVAVEEQPANP